MPCGAAFRPTVYDSTSASTTFKHAAPQYSMQEVLPELQELTSAGHTRSEPMCIFCVYDVKPVELGILHVRDEGYRVPGGMKVNRSSAAGRGRGRGRKPNSVRDPSVPFSIPLSFPSHPSTFALRSFRDTVLCASSLVLFWSKGESKYSPPQNMYIHIHIITLFPK